MSSEMLCLSLPISIALALIAGVMLSYADYLFAQFRRFNKRYTLNLSPISSMLGLPWLSIDQFVISTFLFWAVIFVLGLMHWLGGLLGGMIVLMGFGGMLFGDARQIESFIAQIPSFQPRELPPLRPSLEPVFAVLIGRRGEYRGVEIECVPNMRVGRSKGNNLVLRQSSVSRKHAKLKYAGGTWYIQDQGSHAGIYINGKREVAGRLKHGDRIKIGSNEFEFREG